MSSIPEIPLDRRTRRIASVVLLAVLVFVVAGSAYLATQPGTGSDTYTEFYVLGPDGEADGYPTTLEPDETGAVRVGIGNHEGESLAYTVVVAVDGDPVTDRTATVGSSHDWTGEFEFSIAEPGSHDVTFSLYRGQEPESLDDPYRDLTLQVEVPE